MNKSLYYFVVSALIASALPANADPVSPQQALDIASQFASGNGGMAAKSANAATIRPTVAYTAKSAGDGSRNLLYVVNSGSGYVVVAGDDAAPEMVLGYSATGGTFSYEQAPENLRYWLGEYARQIEYMTDHGITAADQAKAAKFDGEVAPMLTTTWNQTAPYNDLCPNGYPTGCVATAMAQVMNYHEWPKQGTGSHSYTWNNQVLSADFGSTTYRWDLMLDSYPTATSGTAEQRQAVATLMYHCGVASEMYYSASASGTYSSNACEGLVNYFGYPRNIQTFNRDFRTYDEWIALIKGEIDAGRPVIMGASSSGGGHEFILDGYNRDGYFHLNWGWEGQSDGYYLVSVLNPYEGMGTGGGTGHGYKYQQEIIANLQPPTDGETVNEIYEICSDGFSIGTESATLGNDIDITYTTLINIGWQPVSVNLGAVIVDGNGKEVAASYESTASEANVSYYFFNGGQHTVQLTLPASLADGQYRIYPAYKHSADGNLTGRIHVSQTASQSIVMTVSGGNATFSRQVTPWQELEVKNIVVTENSSFSPNLTTTVMAEITNGGDDTFSGQLNFALLKQDSDEMVFYRLAYDPYTGPTGYYDVYTIAPGETQRVELSLRMDGFSATDEYYRVAVVDEDLNVVGTPQLVKSSNPLITITGDIEILPSPENVDANNITARVTLTNNYDQDYLSGISAVALDSRGLVAGWIDYATVEVKAGGSTTVTFNGSLPGAEAGESYVMRIHNSAINTYILPYKADFTIGTSYTGIEETTAAEAIDVKAYPNPVSDVLNITATAAIGRVDVYGITGALVASHSGNGSQSMQISVAQLAAGTYFVRIATASGIKTVKIMRN